jgi:predicted MPP superfamily phosphohydrolase
MRGQSMRPSEMGRRLALPRSEQAEQSSSHDDVRSEMERVDSRDEVLRVVARRVASSPVTRAGVSLVRTMMPPTRVHLTRYDVAVPGLPHHLDGLRILHLSDLHVHPGSDLAWQLPDLIASLAYDLLCYTGDFIDMDDDLPALSALLARMPRTGGAYAVLGNHDYIPFGRSHGSNDVARLRSALAQAGITVLANEARATASDGLYVVGVDDPATRRDNLELAMAYVPEDACTVVLAHSPDVVLRLSARRPSLVLAGHTHGGQIRLPHVGPVLTLSQVPRHLTMGLVSYQGVPLFVSRGIGYSGLYLRLGSPPEAALLTLRAAA